MSVVVEIADQERPLEQADPHWVTHQIEERKRRGQLVCVRVAIQIAHVALRLATPTCAGAGGGGRCPNQFESEIIDLWRRHRLFTVGFNGGDVVAFLQQLRRLVR